MKLEDMAKIAAKYKTLIAKKLLEAIEKKRGA